MTSEIAKRDENDVPVLMGITDDASQQIRMLRVDPTTGRLLVSGTGGGGVGAWFTPPESPAPNGSVLVFTVGARPTDVAGDGILKWETIDYTYASNQITFNNNSAPTQTIRFR